LPKFVYTPEGADPQEWEFDPLKLMSPEAEAIEKHCNMIYGQWAQYVTQGSILAIHGLLYVLLKRSRPTLKWDEVQFSLSEVEFKFSDDEEAEVAALSDEEAQDGQADPKG